MFKIAIIGRPNVGKSTLFNRLVGKKLALVDDQPGVTRDRREGEGRLGDLNFTIIDTAGLEQADKNSLLWRMKEQTEIAIDDCNLALFMIDVRSGIMPDDRFFAEMLRKSGKPIVVVANKAETKLGIQTTYEAFSLGLGDPIPFSAEHGEGLDELYQQLRPFIDDYNFEKEDTSEDKPISVAIVGRPNAGKSTLINALIGEERMLVGAEAGITRDSISVEWTWNEQKFKLVDTAGLRKRAKVEEKLEKMSTLDTIRALKFAEIVVVCMDITKPFEEQDLRIADLASKEGRGVVIAFTKSDMIPKTGGLLAKMRTETDHWLPQIKGAPITAVSALASEGFDHMMKQIMNCYDTWNKRVTTSQLNRWLEDTMTNHPPPAVSGRRIKIRYMTQIKSRPPTFVGFTSRPEAIPESYQRYLVNSMRIAFKLTGVPVRLQWKKIDNPYSTEGVRKIYKKEKELGR